MTIRERLTVAVKMAVGLYDEGSAKAAYGLLSGLYPSAVGAVAPRGTREILEAYSTMPWLRAVEMKISQSVGATQWQLFAPARSPKQPKPSKPSRRGIWLGDIKSLEPEPRRKEIRALVNDGTLRPIEQHVMLDAIRKANSYLVGQALMRTTQIHVDLVGEAFWVKERNGLGAPTGFWPVPPHWVRSTPTPTNPFYYVQFSAWHGPIPDSEILWFCDADPANPYGRGTGIARALADELETDEFAARHTRMTFINRARPDFIVWPEETKTASGEMSAGNAQRLAERWRAEHQGFWRAALPFFATRKIGVKELAQTTFRDLDLVPLREFERNTIRQVFGVPPEMLGIIEPGAARATIETGEYIYEKHVVQPRREFLRATLQERLLPEYDESLILDYVSTVDQDRQYMLDVAKAAPWSRRVDEWREVQQLEPLPDGMGQVFIVPTNVEAKKDISEPKPEPPPGRMPFAPGIPPPAPPAAPSGKRVRGIDFWFWQDEAVLAACRDAGDQATLDLLAKADDNPDDLPEASRRAARKEPAVRRLVHAQLADLRERTSLQELEHAARSAHAESALVAAVPVRGWAADIAEPTRTWLLDGFMVGAYYGADVIGAMQARAQDDTWNRVNPEALAWAQAHAGALITGVSAATQDGVRQVVLQALREGWDAAKTARVIRESVGLTVQQAQAVLAFAERMAAEGVAGETATARLARYADAQRRARALTIARTELVRANVQGQLALWRKASADGALDLSRMEKQWIVTPDERLCPDCEALGEAGPVPVDEPFGNDEDGPPDHPNCRCAVGLVRKGQDRTAVPARQRDSADIASAVAAGFAPLAAAIAALAAKETQVHVHPPRPLFKRIVRDEQGYAVGVSYEERAQS